MQERGWRKGNSYTFGGNVNWCSHNGKQCGGSSKAKNRATIWFSNPTPGHISRQSYSSRYMYPIFTEALNSGPRTITGYKSLKICLILLFCLDLLFLFRYSVLKIYISRWFSITIIICQFVTKSCVQCSYKSLS